MQIWRSLDANALLRYEISNNLSYQTYEHVYASKLVSILEL